MSVKRLGVKKTHRSQDASYIILRLQVKEHCVTNLVDEQQSIEDSSMLLLFCVLHGEIENV